MKVYASRYIDPISFIESIMGQDVWVLCKYRHSLGYRPQRYIKPINFEEPGILNFNMIGSDLHHYSRCHISIIMRDIRQVYTSSVDHIEEIIRPVELYTTQDIIDLVTAES